MEKLKAREHWQALIILVVLATAPLLEQTLYLQVASASVAHKAYLPIVYNAYPPFPGVPFLLAIENSDGDGNFAISWTAAVRAENYELEERWQERDWFRIYTGSATQIEMKNRPPGKYSYQCRGKSSWGYGQWSNLQMVNVQGNPPTELSTPSSSSTSASGMSIIKVVNDCPNVLRLDFAGPQPLVMELPKCELCRVYSLIGPIFCPTEGRPIQEIRLMPGGYRVFASVDNPDVRPWVGYWDLLGNRRYVPCFYVLQQWASFTTLPNEAVSGHCN